jgi:predicted PurR-regulated permease PerM
MGAQVPEINSPSQSGTIRQPSRQILHPPPAWGWTAAAFFVGLLGALLAMAVIWLFGRTLALLALGLAIAAALSPFVNRMERRIPRLMAIILIYMLIFLVFIAIIWIIFPAIVEQGAELVALVPEIANLVQDWYEAWGSDLPLVETFFNQIVQFATTLMAVPLGLASAIVQIFLVFFVSLYTLAEAPKMRRFVFSLFPPGRRERVMYVIDEMAGAMGGFVRGTVIIAILVGLLTFIGLTLIGVRFSLVLGLIAGVLELLPYLGPILASVPMLLVALLDSPTQALVVLVFFVILQQVESNIFVPNIMHSQTEISPLLAMLAIVAGGSLGGLLGALVAIPLAAAFQVFVVLVIAPFIRRQTGAEQHVQPVKKREVEVSEDKSDESKPREGS